jgi:hypothetical protein
MDWTTTGLLSAIRSRASIPDVYATGSTDAALLSKANAELTTLVAEIIALREGHFLRYKDTTISSTKVSYRVPSRAIGGRAKLIQLLDGNSKVLRTLEEVDQAREADFFSSNGTLGYFIYNNEIRFMPSVTNSAVTLRIWYYQRPPELVLTSDSGVKAITTVSYSSPTLTLTSASHGFSTSSVLDVVRIKPPFEAVVYDTSPVTAPTNDVTFTTTTYESGSIAVGDYLCTSDRSIVPQIPDVYWQVLVIRTAIQWCLSKGKLQLVSGLEKELQKVESNALTIVSPRIETGGPKLIPRFSFLGNIGGFGSKGTVRGD